ASGVRGTTSPVQVLLNSMAVPCVTGWDGKASDRTRRGSGRAGGDLQFSRSRIRFVRMSDPTLPFMRTMFVAPTLRSGWWGERARSRKEKGRTTEQIRGE